MSDKERDMKTIKNPDTWIYWPLLPLKRRKSDGSEPDGGVLKATEPLTFLEGANLFAMSEPGYEEKFTPKKVTAEQLLNDGWEVD